MKIMKKHHKKVLLSIEIIHTFLRKLYCITYRYEFSSNSDNRIERTSEFWFKCAPASVTTESVCKWYVRTVTMVSVPKDCVMITTSYLVRMHAVFTADF